MNDGAKSLKSGADMTRRGFVSSAALATGYALAVSPAAVSPAAVSPAAVSTPTDGLAAGTVMIPTPRTPSTPITALVPRGAGQGRLGQGPGLVENPWSSLMLPGG